MKRRLLQTLITTAVVSSLIVTPVLATPQDDADSFEQRKSQAEAQAEAQVESLEQQKSQAEAQADSVNNELVNLLVEYDALQKDMETQEGRIVEAENDLKDAEAKEKQQYEDMKLRIKYMYEEGDSSFFSTLVDAKSYADLVNKAEYIQKVHDYDRKMLNKYVETKNEVAELKDNLEEGQAEMQALSDEMVVQKGNLETTLTQMKSQIEDFDDQLVQAKEAAAEELRRIEEEQRAAEAAEAAAREQAEREQAAAEQQTPDNEGTEDAGQQDDPGITQPSDTSDDKAEDTQPSDDDKEDSKDDSSQDDKQDDDDKQEEDTGTKPGNSSLGQQIADMGDRKSVV